jgi:hypothetical protein
MDPKNRLDDVNPATDNQARQAQLGETGALLLGPAVEVSTTERVSVRIATNQYGVKTAWVSGEDGQEYGMTHAGHQQETAHWIISRLLESSRKP